MLASPSLSPGTPSPLEVAAPRLTTTRKPKPTVLLVDDDSSVCNSICRVLSTEALQVVTAHSVKDGLSHISRNIPDLVMTDLCMAPLTGWDFILHLKYHYPALPVFVITALARQTAGGVDRVATAFFQKPLDLETLLTAIRRQLVEPGNSQNSSLSQP
jgi:DNA-binding NtrC family response regulator